MAKITDPDFLSQYTEVAINPTGKVIALYEAGNLSTDGVTLQALYSFLKEQWRIDDTLIKYEFPIEAITPEQFEFINGWDLSGVDTKNLVRDGGWALKDLDNLVSEEYMNLVTLGSFTDATDKAYYQQTSSGAPTDIVLAGPVNQAIQIYDSGSFNYRSYFKIYLRESGKTYDSYDLLKQQNISSLTYKKYALPLSNSTDLNISAYDSFIATGDPYTGINVVYFDTPVQRTIGTGTFEFDIIVSGFDADKAEIYEKIQWLLRQNDNINSGDTQVTGKITDVLMNFVGDTLNTTSGVYIDDFQADDINSLTFIDVSGVTRTYPFTSAGSLLFNTNLQNDPSAKYWMYFTSVPDGNFGDSDAIIVQDADSLPITGLIGGSPSVSFTFNYDSNTQGSRTAATDADVTVVGIGLTGAQYVVTTSTIARSVANSISVISVLERNYSNL